METAVGVYPIVYTCGIGVPFRREGYALCYLIYTSFGVGICCFFSLTHKVFLGPQRGKDYDCNMIPASFCFDS